SEGRHLGHVEGFLVDDEQQISHFVLEHGHLWGKREIVIAIGVADRIESDGVTLSMTKDEVEKLESRPVHRWERWTVSRISNGSPAARGSLPRGPARACADV